jgi:heterodisulfide reductase subunit A2
VENLQVDTLVVGGGIAGMQTALDLADQGFKVALLEHEPSIGGKMITLSKVFPTLDCCSCITTPKMSSVAHHPNIHLLTYCELLSFQENGVGYLAKVVQKPRYVDAHKCTGCRMCEYACPVTVPNPSDRGLGSFRAIRVPFSTAVPQTAVLDIENCIFCGICEKECPTNAVDFTQKPESFEIEMLTVIVAS